MSLLSIKNLSVKYENGDGSYAVKGMNLVMNSGEIVGIVGESGSGKSSAMLALTGLLPEEAVVTADEIVIDGIDMTPPNVTKNEKIRGRDLRKARQTYEKQMGQIRGRKIAMIFQDPTAALNDSLTVGQQLTETIQFHEKCQAKEAKEKALELLDLVGIHDAKRKLEQYPYELSGGMRQRIVIAIALACRPKLLIADEPTTALDVTVQGQILAILQRIAKETDTAVLLVSHDLAVIAGICQKVYVIKKGVVVENATTNEIFYEPEHPYTKELVSQARKIQKETNLSLDGANENREIVLKLDGVSMSYEKKKFSLLKKQEVAEEVKNVSLEIYRGETFGLVGESGCGKTTLAKLMTGLFSPKEGEIILNGKIQMVFQNYYGSLNPRMAAGKMLEEILMLTGVRRHSERLACIHELLELSGLSEDVLYRYPRELSGGQRQRLAVARALAGKPEILILDEALSGLDVTVQAQMLELLKDIQKKKQISYLFISHDIGAIRNLSHRLGVMYQGRIVESGDTKTICKEPWHPYTKELMQAVPIPDPIKARRKCPVIWTEEGRHSATGKGCPYASRCGYAQKRCKNEAPPVYSYGERQIACFLYEKDGNKRSRTFEMTVQI